MIKLIEALLVSIMAIVLVIFGAIINSILLYLIWNALAPIYLSMLPAVYLHIPFWHCVGILVVLGIITGFFTKK
jgi:hypothetical protein